MGTSGNDRQETLKVGVGFGIVGTGAIAAGFAVDLAHVDGAELVAVTSRRRVNADEFAARHGGRVFDDLAGLAADPSVDVVYIATPNHRHTVDAVTIIDAGKGVLCEKPFAVDADGATRVIDAARDRGVFCMEAMWMRFIPAVSRALDIVESGAIGTPSSLHVDFGIRAPFEPTSRLFDPAKGGGALLDLGIYGLSLSHWLFGTPDVVRSTASIGATGVDEQFTAVLGHGGHATTTVSAAVNSIGPNEAVIAGPLGTIRLPGPICAPRSLRLLMNEPEPASANETEAERNRNAVVDVAARAGKKAVRVVAERLRSERHSFAGNGYRLEISEVVDCIQNGRSESLLLPLDDTAAVMRTLDEVQAGWSDRV